MECNVEGETNSRVLNSWDTASESPLRFHLGMDGLSEKADKVIAALSRTPLNRRDPIPEFMYPETLVKRKLKEKTVL